MADWGVAPTILVFSDSDAGIAKASDSVLAHGARLAAALPIAEAVDRLDSQIAVDLVILDVSDDHGEALDRLLAEIEQSAIAGRYSSIVIVTPRLLDIVSARIDHADISLLVGRDVAALELAIGERLSRTALQLREASDEEDPRRSVYLTEEIGRIGRALAAVVDVDNDDEAGEITPEAAVQLIDSLQPPDATAIRDMIRARRLRDELFGPDLFADPAWDILLDLTAARIEGRSVAVSSLCIAAAVPATTALRWIKQLTDAGLLRRNADPVDGRRVFIALTDTAAAAMMAYFAALLRGFRT